MYDNIKRVQAEMALLDKANKANEEMGVAYSDGWFLVLFNFIF
jgi:hypothetical protein